MPEKTATWKRIKKRNFSSFTYAEAFQQLNIKNIGLWTIDTPPKAPSEFLNQRLEKLSRLFDLTQDGDAKQLLVDAICEEAIYKLDCLKVWKGAKIESDRLAGRVDYILAERKDYLDQPFLCVIEAQNDDFEEGLAQCLLKMQACQWQNRQPDGYSQPIASDSDTFGIISNGSSWRFCKLLPSGEVYQTLDYSTSMMDVLLGQLRYVFTQCNQIMIDRENSTTIQPPLL